jgi:ribonucleoside-diphosphate reductase alpha chain
MMEPKTITKIIKRDGRVVEFEPRKITDAIRKAFIATRGGIGEPAQQLSDEVVEILETRFKKKVPTVENVQDIVEEVLIRSGYPDVAKAYILYRQKRSEIREAKQFFGVRDELKLTLNAISVLQKRYLKKDEEGRVIETPAEMFRRVAKTVAAVDEIYGRDAKRIEEEFYSLMADLEFLPNSPTLMNAGTRLGQLSACFVIPVEDSMYSIFEAVKNMAIIHKSGGGTGFSFSKLRPKGDVVISTKGIASGPVSFMRAFDTATDVIKQGGRRRGANMGILRVDHPDILEFITAKTKEDFLTNFNISVTVTDKFMKAVQRNEEYDLVNPRTGKAVRRLKANDVFDLIATMAWKTGDPGLVFIDRINRFNPTPNIGQMESTNPCGEQPLLPNESCNLGSINLLKMIGNRSLDYQKLKKTIRTAVHFLDNIIDANKYPVRPIERITKANRKIGLGVMGFADALIKLGIPYNSKKAVSFAERLMKFFSREAIQASVELAKERGSFPNFKGSIWEKRGYSAMRNATITTIAPTGTISIIAGTTSGIEPLFAVSFVRNVMEGTKLLEVNLLFEEMAKNRRIYSKELMMEIAKTGSIQDINGIPEDLKRLFVTTFDITPAWHVRIQAAFQKYTDNAVSKTINFKHDATVDDVKKAFMLAYKLGCKGITVYRYGSKKEQVLYVSSILGRERGETLEYTSAEPEYSGGCPTPACE